MEIKTKAEREKEFLSVESTTMQQIISDIEHALDANYGKIVNINMAKYTDRIVVRIKELYESKGYKVTRNHGNDQRDGSWDSLEII